ncbi:MAG: GDP-L-fucose synthase family protein [Sulfobacillus sp.]
MSEAGRRIYVAGHQGLVGSALMRQLEREGHRQPLVRRSSELDLRDGAAVRSFFDAERPEVVLMAAARVGGILVNSERPAEFIYDNLAITVNVIDAAYKAGVQRLVYLGSSCIYPRLAPQPLKEASLLTGPLEPTNEAYAVAKIAGVKMCEYYNRQYGTYFTAVMPSNLYGPCDNFDLNTSHVIPALIRKFHDARVSESPEVEVWGTGKPLREFLYVDDLARACAFLADQPSGPDIINVGSGEEISIIDLAHLVARVTGYPGTVRLNPARPDGTPRKVLDSSLARDLGWTPKVSLEQGLERTYRWFLENTKAPGASDVS